MRCVLVELDGLEMAKSLSSWSSRGGLATIIVRCDGRGVHDKACLSACGNGFCAIAADRAGKQKSGSTKIVTWRPDRGVPADQTMKLHKNRDQGGLHASDAACTERSASRICTKTSTGAVAAKCSGPTICTKTRQIAAEGLIAALATLSGLLVLCPWGGRTRAIQRVLEGHFFSYLPQLVCFHTLLLYSTLYPNSDKKRINGKNYRIAVDRSTCGSFRDH